MTPDARPTRIQRFPCRKRTRGSKGTCITILVNPPDVRYAVPQPLDETSAILDAFVKLAGVAHELSNKSGMQMNLFVRLLEQSRIHDCREVQEAIRLGYDCVEETRHLMADIYALHSQVVRVSLFGNERGSRVK